MILTVELYLKVNDETVTLLQEYGKLMRHEIYKVVGVFQKRGQVFNLPYRAVSRKLAPGARHLVMKQAKILYEKRCTNPDEKPDFSSIWPTKACRIENHFLLLRLDTEESDHELRHIPFSTDDNSAAVLSTGNMIDVTLKQQESAWFAYVRINTDR